MRSILFILFFMLVCIPLKAQTEITFLHFNDLHAHLVSHKDLVRTGDHCATDNSAIQQIGYRGGLSRLKTMVDSIKTANPNNVLMNIGDTYHGGVEAAYTSGNAIVDPVNAIGFDIGVPGNWDFAYGAGVFRKRYTPIGPFPPILNPTLPSYSIKSPNFTYLAANLTYDKLGPMDSSPDGGQVLPPSQIINIGGKDIGFIGITSDIVPMMYEQLATGFNFLQGESNYINLINTLSTDLKNNGAVMVVVMSELGIHKDYQLAQNINTGSVDVFFSAHTHEFTFEPLESASGAIVVEAGNDGYLGELKVTINNDNSVNLNSWNLFPILPTISEDQTVKNLVDNERAPFLTSNPNLSDPIGTSSQTLHNAITDTIGHSNITLTRLNSLESNFNNSFTDILKQYSGMQTAITPGFRFDSPTGSPGSFMEGNVVATGEITTEDVYRFFPVFYTLATAEVRVDTLTNIIEKLLKNVYSTNAFEQGGGWVDGFSGLEMDINLNNADFNRVTNISLQGGGTLNPTDILSIVGCQRPLEASDVICSHTGFMNKADFINPNTTQPWTPIQVLEDYLSTDTINDPNRNTFNDVSGNDVYPYYPWVQPLPSSANCVVLSISENAFSESKLTIYPNPSSDFINFNFEEGKRYNVGIFSILGQKIKTFNNVSNSETFNIKDLSSGSYLITLTRNGKRYSTIFIKM